MKTKCATCRKLRQQLRLLKQDIEALKESLLTYGTHQRSCPCARDIDGATVQTRVPDTCTCGFTMFSEFVETGKLDLNQVIKNVQQAEGTKLPRRDMPMRVYAFDVDETLEISGGPVKLQDLMQLRIEGNIVGLCGNWAVLTQHYPGWQHLVSFINVQSWMEPNGTTPSDKAVFLYLLKTYTPADDYVMVGNILGVSGGSDDQGAAARAGWRFIKESDFANGAR